MNRDPNRRQFLAAAAATGLTLATTAAAKSQQRSAGNELVVGVMGMGGRGTRLAEGFEQIDGVRVAYVCDVDRERVARAAEAVRGIGGQKPQTVGDFRRILDDKSVDVLVIAASNHWHAPAAILGCAAGKHVYVEKPCSHNPHEGELMVAAARKHRRKVQMGNQRRSRPHVVEAVGQLRDGAIGRVYLATTSYNNARPSLGRGQETSPPETLDYDLWQGPAPRRPYRDNLIHNNCHWFWHWGNGELGNNGVHTIDVCRWGLGVDYPLRVSSTGGRYHYDDDQQTPDTNHVTFDFADRKSIAWTGLSCQRKVGDALGSEATFYGDQGTLVITGNSYLVFDPGGKEVRRGKGRGGEAEHLANFVDAIRSGGALNSEIEEGHKSTMLCHLGNMAYRTGRSLICDPQHGGRPEEADAMALWKREYAPGWEPVV
jgi:predicted dehydrogenase